MVVSIQLNTQSVQERRRHLLINIDNGRHVISTIATSNPEVVTNWINETLANSRYRRHYNSNRLIVGLGVQWPPSSIDDDDNLHHYPAATVQLCVVNRCLVYHLHRSDECPPDLRQFLGDPRITFVGLYTHEDSGKLLASPNHNLLLPPNMPLDLRFHIHDRDGYSLRDASVSDIVTELFHVDLWNLEDLTRSDWQVQELNYDQVAHASVDAYFSFRIGLRFHAWRFNTNLNIVQNQNI